MITLAYYMEGIDWSDKYCCACMLLVIVMITLVCWRLNMVIAVITLVYTNVTVLMTKSKRRQK